MIKVKGKNNLVKSLHGNMLLLFELLLESGI